MGGRWQNLRELLGRYRRVFSEVWQNRFSLDSPPRTSDEREFLPAALSLQESPPHPLPHLVVRMILFFFVITLMWAVFGHIDIVATTQGRIVPTDRIKLIQPVETAVINAIYVRDGQRVSAGELLVKLEPTESSANVKRLENELEALRYREARAAGLLHALQHGNKLPELSMFHRGKSTDVLSAEKDIFSGQFAEYLAQKDQLESSVATRIAQAHTVDKSIAKLQALLPFAQKRARDYQRLGEKQYVAGHSSLESRQQLIEIEKDLEVQEARRNEIAASLEEAQDEIVGLEARWRRIWLDQRTEARNQIAAYEQDLIKARQRLSLTQLRSPVSGTVQQLAVHTVGGVATEAQPLMVIVPASDAVEVEAFVANKDIGFIYPGQRAEVKVEAFPYTKYGKIGGKVVSISEDAVEKEGAGLVYMARILLEKTHVLVGEKEVRLSPGMVVTSEIHTGVRRIIEYFLSPLMQYQDESLKER